MENFSPNQTKFSVQRADPVSRYRFSLSARTQVGSGEAATEETPAPPNEGRSMVTALGGKGPRKHQKLGLTFQDGEEVRPQILSPAHRRRWPVLVAERWVPVLYLEKSSLLDMQADLSLHFAMTYSAT